MPCKDNEHNWVGGDTHSDFICSECGARSNLEEDDS